MWKALQSLLKMVLLHVQAAVSWKNGVQNNHHCPENHFYQLFQGLQFQGSTKNSQINLQCNYLAIMLEAIYLYRYHQIKWVCTLLLHIHSGTGNLVTSFPALPVLSSGCPKDSWCNSCMTLLKSASEREELRKYGSICLLFGVMYFLCPAYALCPCIKKIIKIKIWSISFNF